MHLFSVRQPPDLREEMRLCIVQKKVFRLAAEKRCLEEGVRPEDVAARVEADWAQVKDEPVFAPNDGGVNDPVNSAGDVG